MKDESGEFVSTEIAPPDDLYFRRNLCALFIRTLDRMSAEELAALGSSESDRATALEEYKKQLADIDARITARDGKPPDVIVGLKTAVLKLEEGNSPKAGRHGGR